MSDPCYHTPAEVAEEKLGRTVIVATDLGHTERLPDVLLCRIHKGPIEYVGWFPGHDDLEETE